MSDRPHRLIAFDLDDTLWPCAPTIQAAEAALYAWLQARTPRLTRAHDAAALREHRRRLSETRPELAHDVGRLRHLSLSMLLRECGYPASYADQAMDHFMAHRNLVEPFPEVREVLRRLGRHYRLVALTNGNADVESTSLRGLFEHQVTAAQAGAAKPHPAFFQHALSLVGCTPGECLHLGDDPWLDIEGARACGLSAVWINRGGRPWPSDLAPAAFAATDLRQFSAWLGIDPDGV